MKDTKRKFSLVSNIAIVVLIFLVLIAIAANVSILMNSALRQAGYPGTLSMLFDYSKYAKDHDARFTGQIISNAVAYFFMLAAVVLFILSLALIKHDKGAKAKSAIIALLVFVPATLGLTGGIVNFFGEGIKTLMDLGGGNATVVLVTTILTFILDVAYLILAMITLGSALKTAVKVNKGEIKPEDLEEKPAYVGPSEEEKAQDREELLAEIRKIVREELDRLDRVVIAKEAQIVHQYVAPAAAPAPAEEPKPAPAPVVEEEDEEEEEGKRKGAPRIPFVKKMVKAEKDIQDKYNELKNYILAYDAKSRLSIAGDTFRAHRKAYVKITLVGKTLKVYFALDPKEFADSPIPVVDVSDKVAYEEVPALLKVKSNLSVKRARHLVKLAFEKDDIKRSQEIGDHNWMKEIRAEAKAK